MLDQYIVIGANGIVGRQVMIRLLELGKPTFQLSALTLLDLSEHELNEVIDNLVNDLIIVCPGIQRLGLILAHRIRETDIVTALQHELRITRDLVWKLAGRFSHLRVVVLGSITGTRVDIASPEAYHYTKDIQKSCVRQSIRLSNVNMNLLELSRFEKHSPEMATDEYAEKMTYLRELIGSNNVLRVVDIADFACQLLDASHPPRGQVITYDGVYCLLQT